ncbi:hypothetical protein [Corallococcus sp. AS-1-6]|uniref:hypothetical protein n=1 Tax=Corallococcus sp. AS-1-6 TaxID=2874599 RepID=UPI001CC1259B|nr:hypothetical protein [Corallococcus sp. AS-1-6]MBZ4370982.1 hypothetical protein [Corallococcus sp. AS-1-6]
MRPLSERSNTAPPYTAVQESGRDVRAPDSRWFWVKEAMRPTAYTPASARWG